MMAVMSGCPGCRTAPRSSGSRADASTTAASPSTSFWTATAARAALERALALTSSDTAFVASRIVNNVMRTSGRMARTISDPITPASDHRPPGPLEAVPVRFDWRRTRS